MISGAVGMTRMDDVWNGQWGKVLAVLAAHDLDSMTNRNAVHLVCAYGTDSLFGTRQRLLSAWCRGDWPPAGR